MKAKTVGSQATPMVGAGKAKVRERKNMLLKQRRNPRARDERKGKVYRGKTKGNRTGRARIT
jgi:hypothetical protein